jgi:ABC-type proline/glycine betaine transport system permease subunit
MSTGAIAACVVLYLIAAADFWQEKQFGMCLVFICYALANVGLILAAKKI